MGPKGMKYQEIKKSNCLVTKINKKGIFPVFGRSTYCQNMWVKICGRSRSDLKMSNN